MGTHSKYPNNAGIYKLTSTTNNKIYIGKSLCLNRRLNVYKNYKPNNRSRGYLKNTIMKYGWDSFKVEILECFDIKDKEQDNLYLLEREAYYIELFDSTNPDIGFNLCKYSNDATGRPRSDEVKEKMRIRMTGNTINNGRKMSEETKEKIRKGNLGKIVSEETREKMRISNTGKVNTPESIEKMKKVKLLMWENKRKLN
jgi:group I intron endonuclease